MKFSFKKYPALYNDKPKMDSVYNIPNKYFSIYQMTGNLILDRIMSPVSKKYCVELYSINATTPVELVMAPKIDYNLSYLNLAIGGDHKNITFIAKTTKKFRIKMYETPDYFMLSVFELNQGGVELLVQQVLLSRSTYSLTFMLPFNFK